MTIFWTVAKAEDLMKTYGIDLPDKAADWRRLEPIKTITSDTIFDYMNGAGEIYLGYRFEKLYSVYYASNAQKDILVEIYLMKTPDDAFGLLSMDWGGEPVQNSSYIFKDLVGRTFFSEKKALYGSGLMRFRFGNMYARILTYLETLESKKAVLDLFKILTKMEKEYTEPEILKTIPVKTGSKWNILLNRLCFLRSHLVLNTIYFLSHENILNLDHSCDAVIVPLEAISDETDQRCQVLRIKYSSHENALNALDGFQKYFQLSGEIKTQSVVSGRITEYVKIEDGWVGYQLSGRYVTIVFQAQDQESAKEVIRCIAI